VSGETVRETLAAAAARLREAGVDGAQVDAELLLAHALSVRRLDLYARPERRLTPKEGARWRALIERRAGREPLPYLTGQVEFFGLPFHVGPGVLIPRPETEVLVEAVLAHSAVGENAAPEILDVGTGSGCIALALASRLPAARIVALDPAPEALIIARENAARLGEKTPRVEWVEGRWPHPGCFDAIVANPPYIASADLESLDPEVRDHEPRIALDGGPDGLAVIRPLLEEAPEHLRPGGLLAMEMAAGQSERVLSLVRSVSPWTDVAVREDLARIPRVLLATRR
jgi:release factor glutamine methyltransferase